MTLVHGIPGIVVFPDQAEDIPVMLMSYGARMDDSWWAWYTAQPFTWPRFWNWWVARRWLIPRDIRKGNDMQTKSYSTSCGPCGCIILIVLIVILSSGLVDVLRGIGDIVWRLF